MANGVAVLPLVEEPAPVSPTEDIETTIGIATANAVAVFAKNFIEFSQAGRLSAEGRAAGGAAVAQLFEHQRAAPSGLDFAAVAYREGLRALRVRRAAGDDKEFERMAEGAITGILEILARVTTFMAN
jgi:hypothetical protein